MSGPGLLAALSPLSAVFRDAPGRRGRPLHIAVLADSLLRYAAAQAIGLSEAGAKVTLYLVDHLREFGDDAGDRERLLADVAAHNIAVVKLERRRLVRTWRQTRALLRDLRDREVTGLLAQAHFDPRYALAGLRLPTALVLHDPRPHSGDSDSPQWPAPLVARFAELTASCLMIHSERLAAQVRPLLRHKPIVVVPHGATISPVPIRRPRAPVLLVAGRLFAYKGVDSAIAALPAIRCRVPDAQLIVAGRAPAHAEARWQELDGVAVEHGYISESRFGELLEQSSVVVLPYNDATQSGVGLQAVGRGIPCVVSAQGALPDLLGPLGDGLVWSTTDRRDLADAVVAALHKDDRFRSAVHQRAACEFAWSVVGARLISELAPFGFGVPAHGA
jgi:glycosyltransferase involved in cell wall biosynthesis